MGVSTDRGKKAVLRLRRIPAPETAAFPTDSANTFPALASLVTEVSRRRSPIPLAGAAIQSAAPWPRTGVGSDDSRPAVASNSERVSRGDHRSSPAAAAGLSVTSSQSAAAAPDAALIPTTKRLPPAMIPSLPPPSCSRTAGAVTISAIGCYCRFLPARVLQKLTGRELPMARL